MNRRALLSALLALPGIGWAARFAPAAALPAAPPAAPPPEPRRRGVPYIGSFAPQCGDIAEDPRYPGFLRCWAGGEWWPKLLLDEPICICRPGWHTRYGCRVDDSTLPEYHG